MLVDGRVRPIRSVLPATLAAQQAGFTRMIVPLPQAEEAKLVAGIDVFGIASITQLVALLQGEPMPVVDPIEVMDDPVPIGVACGLPVDVSTQVRHGRKRVPCVAAGWRQRRIGRRRPVEVERKVVR